MLTRAQNPQSLSAFTDITICVDRSGSMECFSNAVREGVAELLQTHGQMANTASVEYNLRVVSFDDRSTVLYTGSASELLDSTGHLDTLKLSTISHGLIPRGSTRLYDTAVEEIQDQARRCEVYKTGISPEVLGLGVSMSVVFMLLTDGADNVSVRSPQALREAVETHCVGHGTSAQFIAANQDAVGTGTQLGFPAETCLQMDADPDHGRAAMASATASALRTVSGHSGAFLDTERTASSELPSYDVIPWVMDYSTGSLDIEPTRN
jgi:hypothetical protein